MQTARLNGLDFDKNPSVVTNVTFTGLVTTDRVDEVEAMIRRDHLPLSGGTMSGDIDMGGQHGAYGVEPSDSAFMRFMEFWFGYGELGSGFGIYEDDGEGLDVKYLFNGREWGTEYGDDTDVMTRSDLRAAIGDIHIPDPDLSEYAKLYTVAALANFVTNADVKASTAIAYLQGDDAKVVITNYDSSVNMPSMSFQQRVEEDGSNIWRIVWNELTRWNWLTGTYLPAHFYGKTQIDGLLDGKADRAWGFYDSHTGNYAPDGYTWVSSPKIAIAAGLAYQRTVTSGGAIWVLESNGLVTESGGNLTNGFFRVSDDEGNSILEIVKGNKRTVGANAEQPAVTHVMGVVHMYIRYSVVSESHPTLKICTALELGDWQDETSADCVANVSWTGTSGAYVAEVWGKTALSRMFVKAEYEIGGETYIKNSAPISADGGIYCTDGIHKVRPVYNNGNITWEVVP